MTLFTESPGEVKEEAAIRRALDSAAPDVVFIAGYARRFARATLAYAHARSLPAVLISDSTAHEARRASTIATAKRWIVSSCAAFFVAGTPQARQLETLGADPSQIFPGYDVVDNQAIRARVDALRLGEVSRSGNNPEPYFLCVSRLVGQKNIPTLIEAARRFYTRRPETRRRVLIAGYGPLIDDLRQKIDSAGISNRVELLGGVPYASMPALYAGATSLILPSTSEPWGLVVNEAMAAGLPVVVSSVCGCAEDLVERDGNGFVFEPFDAEALTNIMMRLDTDADLRKRMSVRSHEIIDEWSLERFRDGASAAIEAARLALPSDAKRWRARAAIALLRLRSDKVRGFER